MMKSKTHPNHKAITGFIIWGTVAILGWALLFWIISK